MSLKTRKVLSVGLQLLLLAVLATGTVASASPLAGQLNFSGTAVVSLLGIDFIPPTGPGEGQIVVLPGANTGDFTPFNAGLFTGTLDNRTEATQPVGTPISIADWLEIPGFTFTLEFIRAGSFSAADCFAAPANQQNCTPAPFDPDGPGPLGPILSPYQLTNSLDTDGDIGSTASFSVRGTALNTSTGDMGAFVGVFNATFQKVPYQTLLATVLAGGTVNAPFTAQLLVEAIPEPSSMALGLGGLILVGAGLVRRRRA
jgi:hypothetical protein